MKKLVLILTTIALLVSLPSCDKEEGAKEEIKESTKEKHTYVDGICTDCGELKPSEGLEFNKVTDDNGDFIGYGVSVGSCTDTDLVFPSKHEGKPVIKVYYSGFEKLDTITSVVIPEGFVSVDTGAFENCVNLESVTLPSTLVEIESWAFMGCTKLKEITLPEGFKTMGRGAFINCTSLEKVNFGGLHTLEDEVFRGCTSLNGLVFPEGTVHIGGYAFDGCQNLYDMVLPKSLAFIGAGAFNECYSLINCKYSGTTAEFEAMAFDGALNNEEPILTSDGYIKRLYYKG